MIFKKEKNLNSQALIPLVALVVSFLACLASWYSVTYIKNAQKVQFRPYIIIEPSSNLLWWDGGIYVKFPYFLKDIGQAPALKILKGYDSYLQTGSGERVLVQPFKERSGDEDALAPTQISAEHQDNINISGFDSLKHSIIRVELRITYEGLPEIDTRRYFSKAIFLLSPIKISKDKIIFIVSQPKLDFGFESVIRSSNKGGVQLSSEYKDLIWLNPNHPVLYIFLVLFISIAIRLILCLFKVFAIRQGEANYREDIQDGQEIKNQLFDFRTFTPCQAFRLSFSSWAHHRTIDDYWLPFFIGFIELYVYPILMVQQRWGFIGAWIGIKVVSQWGSWQKSRTAYNRFLLGNILVLLISFCFLITFFK